MAKKKKSNPSTNLSTTKTFFKGLNKDSDPSFIEEGMWNHARNAVNNTKEGDIGTLSNEESNALCGIIGSDITTVSIEVVIIGAIPLYSGKWVIYSTIYKNNGQVLTCEIGLFEEEFCKYRPIVRDKCLDFDKFHLVSGASREKEDCTWQVYWADGKNPDRYMNIGDPKMWPSNDYIWNGGLDGSTTVNYYINGSEQLLWPGVAWEEDCELVDDCNICSDLNYLDCDKIRLASLVKTPCIKVKKSDQPGVLRNGSYAFAIAYTINDQVVTNYFSTSVIQPIFSETDEKGAIELELDLDTENFDQFLLVCARYLSETPSLKDVGYYSTKTTKLTLDQIDESLKGNSELIVFARNPVYETSEQIVNVNKYLLKIGPIGKFDFNYQPLANLIRTKWVSVEYNEKYYINGGNKTGYLRDEVYAFFIRWVYDTGDKSASYHIPGRASRDYNGINEEDPYTDNDTLPGEAKLYETINTGIQTSGQEPGTIDDEGGVIVAKGDMGYWESSEVYPDNNADRYNATSQCFTKISDTPENRHKYDLCGKNIRHHKFPDNKINHHFRTDAEGNSYIRLMGVEFENIILPKDNKGNDIPGIVGYEILRGSREANKSIVAKGMVNNFRDYKLQGGTALDNVTALYANYPFNCIRPVQNNSNANSDDYAYNDPYIVSKTPDAGGIFSGDNSVNQNLPQDLISFHSPDTSFYNPFLSMTELKVYGHLEGTAEQRFIEPNGHPEFKLLANTVVLITVIGGVINAILKAVGEIHINYPGGTFTNNRFQAFIPNPAGGLSPTVPLPTAFTPGSEATARTAANAADTGLNTAQDAYFAAGGPLLELFPFLGSLPGTDLAGIYNIARNVSNAGPGAQIDNPSYQKTITPQSMLPDGLDVGAPVGLFLFNMLDGAETTANLLYQIAPFRQYALEQISHGEYTSFLPPINQSVHPSRFVMSDGIYVFDSIQAFPEFQNVFNNSIRYRINNKNRPKLVAIRTESGAGQNIGPRFIYPGANVNLTPGIASVDQSLMTLGNAIDENKPDVNFSDTGKLVGFTNPIASNYAGLKFNVRGQYGQLDSIAQVIATPCEQRVDFNSLVEMDYGANSDCPVDLTHNIINTTDVFFGGDTYINRFTEKNIMPFFKNWLYNQVNGTAYNYYLVPGVPYPRFWANSNPWDFNELLDVTNIIDAITGNSFGSGLLPNSYFELDGAGLNFLTAKNDYFYLSNNGIRDFFVESSVLVDFRDRGTFEKDEFYSKYKFTDLEALFNMKPEIIKAGNSYIYDYSYSVSKFTFTAYTSKGLIQVDTYDPNVADICLTSLPNRINYSLPQQEEETTDGWLTFLNFNRVVFRDNVNFVKKYGKTGMFLTFENSSPLVYQGVDQRENYIGVKATIGDGGLFSATPISLTAADDKYEFGSAQDRLGVVSTPVGMFFMSQQQGRIFTVQKGSLQEISAINMRWWFNKFLPYKLIEDFPDFPHVDNPVAGIGCSAGYNNADTILYFSKKDYQLKSEYKGLVTYDKEDNFIYSPVSNPDAKMRIKLGDEIFFNDASWTISYDPKNKKWISFHDWHPNLYLSGRDKHYTTKLGGIWEHNAGCNDYCNFYDKQFPFEIGIPMSTQQNVTTLRSFEYILECYRRDNLYCVDQYHVLDYNFDEAVIYNSEQVSGYLNLNIFPKNNIALAQDYPKINLNSIDILVAKEENKYRFNQFWDITKDRGEFPEGSDYPPTGPLVPGTTRLIGNYAQEQIWTTEANGYIHLLNDENLDYDKNLFQRKKFRHYNNFIRLAKADSRDTNMVMKILNSKNQLSVR